MTDAKRLPTVSVALCTHNGAAYLERQLASILDQSHSPRQIVLSDDDSSDDTIAIAERVFADYRAAGGAPIEVLITVNRPALGIADNFAAAMLACDSELIALCDQDDAWHPDRLAHYAALFAAQPQLTLAHGDARLVDGAGEALGSTLFEAIEVSGWETETVAAGRALDVLLRRNIVTGATTVLRRSALETMLPIPAGWIHDEWAGVVAALLGQVAIAPGTFTDYRQHGGNQIGAVRLGLRGKVDRLREPRTERNARLLQRAQSLADRVDALGERVSSTDRALVHGKVAHERRRSALPAVSVLRLPGILASAARGDYRRFGRGAQDMLRDLVQRAD